MVKGPLLALIALVFNCGIKTTLNMKRQTNRKWRLFVSALALMAGVFSLQAQNGIEPRYEKYNADRKSIEVDGDLSDWTGVPFIKPKFEASDGRETGKGNTTVGDKTYSTFAEFGGGTWSGPDDFHCSSMGSGWSLSWHCCY